MSWLMISDKSTIAYMFPYHGGAYNVPKVSANKAYKKIVFAFNYYLHAYL